MWGIKVGIALLSLFLFSCGRQSDQGANRIESDTISSAVGSASEDFLSARSRALNIETIAVGEAELASETQEYFKAFINEHLQKPDGIDFTQAQRVSINTQGRAYYTSQDLRNIEQIYRRTHFQNGARTAFLLVLDKPFFSDSATTQTYGLAYSATSMAIFTRSIEETSSMSPYTSLSTIEASVLAHEFGHLLGLVNRGTTPQANHEDTSHGTGGHCINRRCLMHYALNIPLSLMENWFYALNITNHILPNFDEDCLLDLRRRQGR